MRFGTPTSDIWANPDSGPFADLRWHEVAREYAWRPSSSCYRCPAPLMGKRCTAYRYPNASCICQEVRNRFEGSVVDHARLWVGSNSSHVLTYEPYTRPDAPVIEEFRAFCAEHGLVVEIGDRSPHAPGNAILVIVRAAH